MGSTDVEYNLVSFQPEQTSEATRNLNEQLLKAAQKDRKWWEVGDQFYSLFPRTAHGRRMETTTCLYKYRCSRSGQQPIAACEQRVKRHSPHIHSFLRRKSRLHLEMQIEQSRAVFCDPRAMLLLEAFFSTSTEEVSSLGLPLGE